MKKSKIILVATFFIVVFTAFTLIPATQTNAEEVLETKICKWATRETSQGWEAICIETGVGFVCECGEVKPYY